MSTPPVATPCKRPRFPAGSIGPWGWPCGRPCLRYRGGEGPTAAPGVPLTWEAVRHRGRQFGQTCAHAARRRRPRPGDVRHVSAVFLSLHGERHRLGRAADRDGRAPEMPGQRRRPGPAAQRFFRQGLRGVSYAPRVTVTDQLKRSGAARRGVVPTVEPRQNRQLGRPAEHPRPPTRPRERRLQGFKSPGHAQRFLASYGPIAPHVRPRRIDPHPTGTRPTGGCAPNSSKTWRTQR
jgi:putative transposase